MLTDFGLKDAYVGIMRGVLASRCTTLRDVVDLTHAIEAQDVGAAAFQLQHAWSYFPKGTVHVAVVDPGVGSERRALIALDRGHAFVAPDNGLLGPILSADAEVYALDVESVALPNRSRTFHGRDVFAPAAAALASGAMASDLGQPIELEPGIQLPMPERLRGRLGWRGVIQTIDHFGNLVSNLPARLLIEAEAAKHVQLFICEHAIRLVDTYADAREGDLLALVDSYDLIEVAVRGGNAAEILNCGIGELIEMELH